MSSQSWFAGFAIQRRRLNGIEINFRHGGSGPPLLLLHGFPQTHAIWHKVAPEIASRFTVVMPDLRGYGDTDKPPSSADHGPYSKRVMANDAIELMHSLGHSSFFVCGHDRGGRVAHRLALDHSEAVGKLMLLDISPTLTMYERTTMGFARDYYHWFFLIQPAPFPERLIGHDRSGFLRAKLSAGGRLPTAFFDPRAVAEYERCFSDDAVHAMCEDYRASATIDLDHDRADSDRRIRCPVRVLWGKGGVIDRYFSPLDDWSAKALRPVTGRTTPSGHYIAEEVPDELASEIFDFFGSVPD